MMTAESTSPSSDPRARTIWENFARDGQVADHFSRAAGRFAGKPAWSLIVPADGEAVGARAREVQLAAGWAHGAEPIAVDRLHITIDTLAIEPAKDWLSAIRRSAAEIAPFVLSIGGANAFPESVMLEVLDPEPVRVLRRTLHERHQWLSGGMPMDAYLPHISVVYFGRAEPAAETVAQLESVRALPPIELEVTRLLASRLEFDATGHSRRIESHEIELGGQA